MKKLPAYRSDTRQASKLSLTSKVGTTDRHPDGSDCRSSLGSDFTVTPPPLLSKVPGGGFGGTSKRGGYGWWSSGRPDLPATPPFSVSVFWDMYALHCSEPPLDQEKQTQDARGLESEAEAGEEMGLPRIFATPGPISTQM